jgi:cytochrome c biogenesis protein CcmG, thiol:disulfide interchange protein DsbE
MSRTDEYSTAPMRRRNVLAFLPLAVAAVLGVVLAWGLTRDPSNLPSTLISKPVPDFALPPVKGRTLGLSSTDLKGEVSLVNVFASWCVACRAEHPLFMKLAAQGTVPLHGLNYKDQPDDAAKWLDSLGDPYTRTGADISGRVAIDWGVYGVPETFVIGADGRVAQWKSGRSRSPMAPASRTSLLRKWGKRKAERLAAER